MEKRALYHTTAPKGPRNLAEPIATWLREQGFAVIERHYDGQAYVAATWTGPRGDYNWVPRYQSATLQLHVHWLGQVAHNLFGAQQVRRLRDVRLLLLGNVRYANARTLATLPHPAL
jgi:hypothetical protein